MAHGTSHLLEEMCTRYCHRFDLAVAPEPLLVLRRWQGNDLAAHARVVGAAVFGTEQVVHTRLTRLEPYRRIASWHHIHLDTKRRYVEAVNGILRGHDHLHRVPDRHVQCVDLPLPARMLKLPHPLLADGIHRQRLRRWRE